MLWQFNYHRGSAPLSAIVEARDQEWAMEVAKEWCKRSGNRPPAAVRPMVVADESIVGPQFGATVNSAVDPVAHIGQPSATSGSTSINKTLR